MKNFIKFGITVSTIKRRYHSKTAMPYKYEIIQEIRGSAEDIWALESKYKQQYKHSHYLPLISFGGSKRECFISITIT